MSNPSTQKQILIRAIFNLIRTHGSYQNCKRHAATKLAQTTDKHLLSRLKHTFNKFKSHGLTSRMGYEETQSVLKMFYLLEFILYKSQKEAFLKIFNFGKTKDLVKSLNSEGFVSVSRRKNEPTSALSDPKLIAAMKIINMYRKLSLYDWKTVKPFRKWQLEDLRNLVNGYERNNCFLYLTLRNKSVGSIVKLLDYARKKQMRSCFLEFYKHNIMAQEFEALKIRKLGNVLMKKTIVNDTMTLNLSIIVTFKRFFKNLAEAKKNEEQNELRMRKALNIVCFVWKKTLACNFRQYRLRIQEPSSFMMDGKMEKRMEKTRRTSNQLRDFVLKRFSKTCDYLISRRKHEFFRLLSLSGRAAHKLEQKKNALEMMSLIVNLHQEKAQQEYDRLSLSFIKIKQVAEMAEDKKEIIENQNEASEMIFEILKSAIRKVKRSCFQKVKQVGKMMELQKAIQAREDEKENIVPAADKDFVIEKNIIKNQSIIASYFEKRMTEIDQQLLAQKKQVLWKKLLIKHSIEEEEVKRTIFNDWYNDIPHLKLSAKLGLLEYQNELKSEINQLSSKLEELMNQKELLPRKDPYIEFHEKKNTELRQSLTELEILKRKKNVEGNLYSP